MSINKRLSIIIPFYNVESYIAQCLESVFSQDIPQEQYEVICVDDCSPDNSIQIVENYAKLHSNLIIVRNQYNRKLGGARNAGLEIASGRYVWFVDSDDFITKNVLHKLLTIVENEDLDVLHFNYYDYPSKCKYDSIKDDTIVRSGSDLFFHPKFTWYNDFVTAWRKLYKKDFLLANNIKFAEHIMFEDNDYALEVFAKAQRVMHIELCAYYYRNNPESITRVQYTDVHIKYLLDLCNRLCVLKDEFSNEQYDNRFIPLINGFIRNVISNVLEYYSKLNKNQKKKARTNITDVINNLKPYMSRIKFYKIKLGLF